MATGGAEPHPAHAGAVGDWLAGRLSAARGPWRRLAAGLHQIGEVDRAVYEAIASVNTPALDSPVRRLSHVADHSVLWLGIAGGIALPGGPAGGGPAGASAPGGGGGALALREHGGAAAPRGPPGGGGGGGGFRPPQRGRPMGARAS